MANMQNPFAPTAPAPSSGPSSGDTTKLLIIAAAGAGAVWLWMRARDKEERRDMKEAEKFLREGGAESLGAPQSMPQIVVVK